MSIRNSSQVLLILFLIGLLACNRAARENEADPSFLLARLKKTDSTEARLTALNSLSSVPRTVLPPEGGSGLLTAVRAMLEADEPAVAAKAGDLLAHWGDHEATAGLVRLLGAPDPMIRFSAANSLASLGNPTSADALVLATGDVEGIVRTEACAALGMLQLDPVKRQEVAVALRVRLTDPKGAVRAAAAQALSSAGSLQYVPQLVDLLADSDPGVAAAAAATLGRMKDRRPVGALVAQLEHESELVRIAAARSLGFLGDRRAVTPLLKALSGNEPTVRVVALKALGQLADPAAVPGILDATLGASMRFLRALPQVLGRLYRTDDLDLFLKRLRDPDPDLRAAVASALGLAGEARATGPLIDALDDPVVTVRVKAAEGLSKLRTADAIAPLRRMADSDPDMEARSIAYMALFALIDPDP